jgi:hypothetical protein
MMLLFAVALVAEQHIQSDCSASDSVQIIDILLPHPNSEGTTNQEEDVVELSIGKSDGHWISVDNEELNNDSALELVCENDDDYQTSRASQKKDGLPRPVSSTVMQNVTAKSSGGSSSTESSCMGAVPRRFTNVSIEHLVTEVESVDAQDMLVSAKRSAGHSDDEPPPKKMVRCKVCRPTFCTSSQCS